MWSLFVSSNSVWNLINATVFILEFLLIYNIIHKYKVQLTATLCFRCLKFNIFVQMSGESPLNCTNKNKIKTKSDRSSKNR